MISTSVSSSRPLDSPETPVVNAPQRASLFALATTLAFTSTLRPALTPEQSTLLQYARSQMEALDQFEDTERSRHRLLARNLSRYFAVYLMPPDTEEFQRLLGTLQRMGQSFARRGYSEARNHAREAGKTFIDEQDVEFFSNRVLPRTIEPWGEVIFFPQVEARRLVLEEIDLRALRDTGFVWEILGHVVETEVLPDPEALPMTQEAAVAFGDTVNAFGLLLLRVAGIHARTDLAPYVGTQHLRLAGRSIVPREPDESMPRLPVEAPPTGEPFLVDVTAAAKLDYRHRTSAWLTEFRRYGIVAPTFSGGGVAAVDIDNDHWPDLVVCGGDGCHLFRNRGDGTLEDVTEASGISHDAEARMPVVADFDNDGRRDLFVTYARDSNRLFRNVSEGTALRFEDVTESSGLFQEGDVSGPAVAFDYDGDALLDLYVGNFGNYLEGASAWVATDSKNAMKNRLYRNVSSRDGAGGLRFEDVSVDSGVEDTGWAQALSHFDYDNDGDQDLYVANDFGRNSLMVNNRDGTFTAAGATTGSDDPHHGMNVSFADLNRDTYPDIFVTNIWFYASSSDSVNETNSVLLSTLTENGPAYVRGEEPPLLEHDSGWSWGALFFDRDNDGDSDLLVLNGFTDYFTFAQYRKHPVDSARLYAINNGRDANLYFENQGTSFPSALMRSGAELPEENSRSLALLDYDRDGDLDAVVTTFHSNARLFRNDSSGKGHWLTVSLLGDPEKGSNRDAIGAVVIARGAGDFYAWRMVNGGEGYLAMSSLPIELGTGDLTTVDLEIRWPSGEIQEVSSVAVDREIRITEGSDEIVELPR